jgi:branched-chain amino acid aminotransferase
VAEYIAYLNGDWMPFADVRVDPLDRGFVLGDVVFDVERTFAGKSFRMKQHIDRLYRSLKYVRIDPGLTADEMTDITEEAIRRNEHLRADVGDFTLNQWVTRGVGGMGMPEGPPAVCVNVRPITFSRYAGFYDAGQHGVIAQTRSYPPEALDP